MILGMSGLAFTGVHTLISLIGVLAGLIVVGGLLAGRALRHWTGVFLASTLLTSITGFFFPIVAIGPAHVVGVLSLIVLAPCLYAYYGRRLAGRWRTVYVATAVIALYFNIFVLIVQVFQKVPLINALAPTGTEPPFAVAQAATLLLFIVLGVIAGRRFKAT